MWVFCVFLCLRVRLVVDIQMILSMCKYTFFFNFFDAIGKKRLFFFKTIVRCRCKSMLYNKVWESMPFPREEWGGGGQG